MGKHLCQSPFLIKVAAFADLQLQLYLKRDSGTGFSFEFCEIFINTSLYRIPPVATSVTRKVKSVFFILFSIHYLKLIYKITS